MSNLGENEASVAHLPRLTLTPSKEHPSTPPLSTSEASEGESLSVFDSASLPTIVKPDHQATVGCPSQGTNPSSLAVSHSKEDGNDSASSDSGLLLSTHVPPKQKKAPKLLKSSMLLDGSGMPQSEMLAQAPIELRTPPISPGIEQSDSAHHHRQQQQHKETDAHSKLFGIIYPAPVRSKAAPLTLPSPGLHGLTSKPPQPQHMTTGVQSFLTEPGTLPPPFPGVIFKPRPPSKEPKDSGPPSQSTSEAKFVEHVHQSMAAGQSNSSKPPLPVPPLDPPMMHLIPIMPSFGTDGQLSYVYAHPSAQPLHPGMHGGAAMPAQQPVIQTPILLARGSRTEGDGGGRGKMKYGMGKEPSRPKQRKRMHGPDDYTEESKRSPGLLDLKPPIPPPESLLQGVGKLPPVPDHIMQSFLLKEEPRDRERPECNPPGFEYDPDLPMSYRYQLIAYENQQKILHLKQFHNEYQQTLENTEKKKHQQQKQPKNSRQRQGVTQRRQRSSDPPCVPSPGLPVHAPLIGPSSHLPPHSPQQQQSSFQGSPRTPPQGLKVGVGGGEGGGRPPSRGLPPHHPTAVSQGIDMTNGARVYHRGQSSFSPVAKAEFHKSMMHLISTVPSFGADGQLSYVYNHPSAQPLHPSMHSGATLPAQQPVIQTPIHLVRGGPAAERDGGGGRGKVEHGTGGETSRPKQRKRKHGPDEYTEECKRSPTFYNRDGIQNLPDLKSPAPPPVSLMQGVGKLPPVPDHIMQSFLLKEEPRDRERPKCNPPGFEYDPDIPMSYRYQLIAYENQQRKLLLKQTLEKLEKKKHQHQKLQKNSPQRQGVAQQRPPSSQQLHRPAPTKQSIKPSAVHAKAAERDEGRPGKLFSLEEERHLATFRSVIARKGCLKQTIMHCLFLGYPGGGKSSLIKRLTGHPPNPTLPSTGVAEKAILVEVFCSSTSTVHSAWEHGAGFIWSILTYDDEAIALMAAASATPTPSKETMNEPATPLYTFMPTPPSSQSDTMPINVLRRAIERKGLEKVQEYLQQLFLLYLTDTGGQLEFQELLPALSAGPTLFFVVFRLDQDLDETVHIQFRYSDGHSSEPYQSSFTVRESLLRSLASIAATGSYVYSTQESVVSQKPKVLFIGTHRDRISSGKMKQIDRSLQEMVKSTSLYRDGLIEFAIESKLVMPVNNLSPDHSDFQQIQSVVKRIAERDNFSVSLPSTWLIFSLIIRQHKKRVITYDECFTIGQQCGIDSQDELNEALWFLTTKVGMVRHFRGEGLEDLEKIVIIDSQILFEMITQLIVSTFTISNVTENVREDFRSKGIFPRNALQRISNDEDRLLTVDRFVTLLEHLHIISRLHIMDEIKYFMPCTLAHIQSTAPKLTHSSSAMPSTHKVPPLLITFQCGYCPIGLFSALVVYLLANKMKSELNWELQTECIYRNAISFCVGPYDTVTLRLTPTYLEMVIIPDEEERELNVEAICTEVKYCIKKAIAKVTSDLHYTRNVEYSLAFYCTGRHRAGVECHPAKICMFRNEPCRVICDYSRVKYKNKLPNGYSYWFNKGLSSPHKESPEMQQSRSPQWTVFLEHRCDIHTGISNSVHKVAHGAFAKNLISDRVHSDVTGTSSRLTVYERTEVFLEELGCRIQNDPTVLGKFVDVLRELDAEYYRALIEAITHRC